MTKKITLPSELDVLAVPPLAVLPILQVTLAMTTAAIHCEHPNLDEIPRYFYDNGQYSSSMLLAQTLCIRADELRPIIDRYLHALNMPFKSGKNNSDLPF